METSFRIIIIDDNPSIHQDFIKILKSDAEDKIDELKIKLFNVKEEIITLPEFEIDVASQGKEGVEYIEKAIKNGKPYSLAFVDIRMPPGWNGIETIKHIWELDKHIQIVICTAYSDYSWEETISHLGKTDNLLILKKPFDNISVRQLACALTKKWQLAADSRRYTEMLKQQVANRTLSLQNSLSLVKSTFESSSDGILVINNNGEIIDYNQKLVNMFQIPQSVLDEKSEISILNHIQKQFKNPEEAKKIAAFHNNTNDICIDVLKLEGEKVFECYSQPHKLNNKIVGRILDFRDISKRAKLESELLHQATHDALTGLANRIKLTEQIHIAINNSEKNNTSFAVLFIDLDRFKLVNDSLSHVIGDELLKLVSQRLQTEVQPHDTLARLGGDEFVIIFTDFQNEKTLQAKIQKLLSSFQQAYDIGERKITVTASIGVSLFPKDGKTVDILLRNADSAMYHAKQTKGNNYKFYNQKMSRENLAILEQEMELRQALIKKEFFLCYQPQIDLSNEKLVAVEALIRWRHPTKGILLPLEFIPLAEETGLIIPISEWVLRTACFQNKAWQDAGFPNVRIAVNITAQQFRQQNLVELVRNVLQESKLKPEFLELELTENVLLSNKEVILTVTELKKLGVHIAIDDFGTGYSSLSYLHKIPLDRLKIDSSFIQHIKSAADDEVIIRAVIALAKNLNLEVLAEGVETVDQLNFLKKYNCEDVQGYIFSEPLTAKELESFFKNPSILNKKTNSA